LLPYLNNFLIIPFKSYDFSKIHCHHIKTNPYHPLLPTIGNGGKPQINGKDIRQRADYWEKPACMFLPVSPMGEQTGGEKLAVLLFPVATASQIVFSME
jgi:hypothetical protein